MTEAKLCPSCQTALPSDAPQGLCPNCLLEFAFVADEKPASTAGYAGAFAPPPLAELAALFPQLEVLALLGQGGMGAVYKASQIKLDRLVALKVVPPELARAPAFAERFTREARALARLSHANIVAVHDFGEVNGLFYFIMEFVDGINLRQMLQAGRVQPPEALKIVPQVCEALQYAHDQGVVHRDIKPENILLDRRGQVKIADFGLAKLLGPNAASANLTGSRQIMGTPHYMAPEQIQHPLEVDQRADIYSLGVVLYEMLTGELPLGRFAPPSQKAGTDVRLDEVVLRTLEKEPERRYQQISHFKTDLEAIGRFLLGGAVRTEEGEQVAARIDAALLHDLTVAAVMLGGLAAICVATYLVPNGLPALGCLFLIWLINSYPWTSSTVKLVAGVATFLGTLIIISIAVKPLFETLGFFLWVLFMPLIYLVVGAYEFTQGFLGGETDGQTSDGGADVEADAVHLSADEREIWRVLKTFADDAGLYLAPDFPADGLQNARDECGASPEDRMLALLDFTGDEDDCSNSLLFGCRGIYCPGWQGDEGATLAIPYEEFPERVFVNHGKLVYLGKNQFLEPDLDNGPTDCETITRLLNALRAAVLARRQRPVTTPAEGVRPEVVATEPTVSGPSS